VELNDTKELCVLEFDEDLLGDEDDVPDFDDFKLLVFTSVLFGVKLIFVDLV
jgi:hypothetical protein